MPVGVDRPDRDDRDRGPDLVEEAIRGRCPAAVVGNLEQVHPGQATADQDGIDLLLDVAGQQEALAGKRAQQDDRHVVDRGAAIRRRPGHRCAIRPENPQADRIELKPIAGGHDPRAPSGEGESAPKGPVGRAWAEHAWFVDPADPIALDEPG
jgi:hypothetical protein